MRYESSSYRWCKSETYRMVRISTSHTRECHVAELVLAQLRRRGVGAIDQGRHRRVVRPHNTTSGVFAIRVDVSCRGPRETRVSPGHGKFLARGRTSAFKGSHEAMPRTCPAFDGIQAVHFLRSWESSTPYSSRGFPSTSIQQSMSPSLMSSD